MCDLYVYVAIAFLVWQLVGQAMKCPALRTPIFSFTSFYVQLHALDIMWQLK